MNSLTFGQLKPFLKFLIEVQYKMLLTAITAVRSILYYFRSCFRSSSGVVMGAMPKFSTR